jgi:hypothetical protein
VISRKVKMFLIRGIICKEVANSRVRKMSTLTPSEVYIAAVQVISEEKFKEILDFGSSQGSGKVVVKLKLETSSLPGEEHLSERERRKVFNCSYHFVPKPSGESREETDFSLVVEIQTNLGNCRVEFDKRITQDHTV